jgi:hypothetical protein
LEIAKSIAKLADICYAMGEQPLRVSLVWNKKQVYIFMPTFFFFSSGHHKQFFDGWNFL